MMGTCRLSVAEASLLMASDDEVWRVSYAAIPFSFGGSCSTSRCLPFILLLRRYTGFRVYDGGIQKEDQSRRFLHVEIWIHGLLWGKGMGVWEADEQMNGVRKALWKWSGLRINTAL